MTVTLAPGYAWVDFMTSLSLEISNAHQALSILGNSCDYFQQFRELTESVADQAQMRPDLNILATWDYERSIQANGLKWGDLQITAGCLKLFRTDNGPGMDQAGVRSPSESCSTLDQATTAATSALAPRSPASPKTRATSWALIITQVVGHTARFAC